MDLLKYLSEPNNLEANNLEDLENLLNSIISTQLEKFECDKISFSDFKKNIDNQNINLSVLERILQSDKINNYQNDYLPNEEITTYIEKLIEDGMIFECVGKQNDFFEIISNEVVFPMCCQGKNRSQFMFYFLKYLQSNKTNNFLVGYPASGDELSLINNKYDDEKHNVVLSGFNISYKQDSFSNSILQIFGKEYSRNPHIFAKILRNKIYYACQDIANLEQDKITTPKYNIYDKTSKDVLKITELYKRYYLNPSNLIELIKIIFGKDILRVTWITMSYKSLENLIKVFELIKKQFSTFDYSKIRIIYFGNNDIFQGNNIKPKVLEEFTNKIFNSFRLVSEN